MSDAVKDSAVHYDPPIDNSTDDINAYRAENGLNPLTWSDELGEQANKRATEQTDNIVNIESLSYLKCLL